MSTELATMESGGEIRHAAAYSPAGGVAAVRDAMEGLKAIRTFVAAELKAGHDFGVIPGTGKKPTLLLPGAQKVAMYYNAWPQYEVQPTELGGGHVEYVITCRLISRANGAIVGSGVGSCSTMESKYRYRGGGRACPECGADAIRKSKYPDRQTGDLGWYCHDKSGGCGAVFHSTDHRIKSGGGKVENPNPHDVRNTVLKMAKKRAQVDAALSLGCLSELFTQDLEDLYDLGAPSPRAEPPRRAEPPARRPQQAPPRFGDWVRKAAEKMEISEYQLVNHFWKWAHDNGWLEGLDAEPGKVPNRDKFGLLGDIFQVESAAFRAEARDYAERCQVEELGIEATDEPEVDPDLDGYADDLEETEAGVRG